jgi:hypothetical protein
LHSLKFGICFVFALLGLYFESWSGGRVLVVCLTARNPERFLLEAKPAFLYIKDYEDPKLWAALEE